MVGFCVEAVKLFGPLQVYVAPIIVFAVKLRLVPEQTGVLLPGVGGEGGGATINVVVPSGPGHPATETETE